MARMFSLRLHLYGFECHDGERRDVSVWWVARRRVSTRPYYRRQCIEHAQSLVDQGEVADFAIEEQWK